MHKFYLLFFTLLLVPLTQLQAQTDQDAESQANFAVIIEEKAEQEEAEENVEENTEEEQKIIAPLPDKASTLEERLVLSRQMHEIWPIRPKVERALDAISSQIAPPNRLKFKSTMRKAIDFDELEQGSIQAMADIYTVKELQAMIDFYGSKEGQSVSHKTDDYEAALKPIMTKMVDKALLDLKTGAQSE